MIFPSLFESSERFRAEFIAGLERQLAEPGLGTFILVLANASFDAEVWPLMRARIEARFAELSAEVRQALRAGGRLTYPEDDLMVFLKLMAMGLEAIGSTAYRAAGPWELQYTPLRALRPTRVSGLSTEGMAVPAFNPAGFHFNKPFLRPEILWEGDLLRRPCRLLYNKFPFAPWHGLLVPEPARGHPQALVQELHLHAWHIAESLGTQLPDFGLSYNSFGAYASVNHLHFQTFLRGPLPVESDAWRHNGGAEDYSAACTRFDNALDAWLHLESLGARGQAYNLIYRPGRMYCLARRHQGGYDLAPWLAGQAWYEMAGGVVAFARPDFEGLGAETIARELDKTRII
jgi:hypothetical protein